MDKKRLILIVALVILMAVVFNVLRTMNATSGSASPEVRTVVQPIDYTQVLSVTEPMMRGDRIAEGDLSWIDWPTDALTPALIVENSDAETSVMDSLLGAVAREPLTPGDPLVMSRFIQAGDAGIMAALLSPGMRAVTVRISVDTASGGFIQPGDKVDVILQETLAPDTAGEGESAQPRIMASTVFENVKVLAIDQFFRSDPENGPAITGSVATLELSPRDSERITVAQARGELSLVLRGFSSSDARASSHASQPLDAKKSTPPLTIYRSGAAQTVAVRGN